MKPFSILVTVSVAGTPVRVTTNLGLRATSIYFKPLAANTGPKAYVGISSTFNKTTGVDLITDISTAGVFSFTAVDASSRINPNEYWVDADTNGDKVCVTYWIS